MRHVFISYVQEDDPIALEIAAGLESAGYSTWYYKRDCVPGPSYLVQTGQAIEESFAVVLVISPNSLGSHQVTKEVVRAHEANKPFIPVLRDIEFPEFQQRQPEWREALGSATSIRIPAGGVSEAIPRIVGGLKSLGLQPAGGPAERAHEEKQRVTDVARKQMRSYLRVLGGVAIILLLSPFVGGTVLWLGQILSRSNPRSLAYVCTAIFDVVAFFFLVRYEKNRTAVEQARSRLEVWAQTSRSAAFRSLDPYSEADTLPGTERKRQARRLVTSIKDPGFRFGVVSGDVGCGKTSLLQSEVQRLLRNDNLTPVLLVRADFADAKDVPQVCSAIKAAAARHQGHRVLIVDQIEEILIRFPDRADRDNIGALFGQLVRGDQPCKIVCAIRKDYFLDLYSLGTAMDIEVRPTLMVHNFTPEEAKEVIRECAAEEGLTLADDLVEAIVADLTKESQIRPPELQIVCTALTANFTMRHYNELGGAKGILESYLTLTLETCIDEQVARLVLRQMCDFEKQAKADPKSPVQLAQSIAPAQDDSGATERIVQLVLDHLVRSRLAVMVGGKFSLIHDYWVSVIRDATIHDRSEQERADELLRRHLHEQEAGFSSTLSAKQLRLVRRFANRDLLNTQEATDLLRKSVLRFWVSRGAATVAIICVIVGGVLSSSVAWKMEPLADMGDGQFWWHVHLVKNAGRLVFTPSQFFLDGDQKRSSISIWDIGTGRHVSEFTADAWNLSEASDVLLYSDEGHAYTVDLKQLKTKTFPQAFKEGHNVGFSRLGGCASYTSSENSGTDSIGGSPQSVQLWSMPEGKSVAHTSLTAIGLEVVFVSETCDRAVLLSKEGASMVVSSGRPDVVENNKPWLWGVHEAQPKRLASGPTIMRTELAVNEKLQMLAMLETDSSGRKSLGLWDLRSGVRRLVRPMELSMPSWWKPLRFGPDGRYVTVSSIETSSGIPKEKITVLRTSDLQKAEITNGRHLIRCSVSHALDSEPDLLLWSTPSQNGYIWDVSDNIPLPLVGMDASDIDECTVRPDLSEFAVLRKTGSAELWSFKGSKMADVRTAGPARGLGWTSQGSSVEVVGDAGQITLFDDKGSALATLQAPGSHLNVFVTGVSPVSEVSFEPVCGRAILWAIDGRVVKYTKKLKVFGLPYLLPIPWHQGGAACNN